MSYYWDSRFLAHLQKESVQTVFEVGARYGDETLRLRDTFRNCIVHSFECNPITIATCRDKLGNVDGVYFNEVGLGEKDEILPFYSYVAGNDGASSFFKRIDFDNTQKKTGEIRIQRLDRYCENNHVSTIDLLCMDVQGYELNVLKGAGNLINNVRYVIMEEPKRSNIYLPEGVHSKYIGAPSSEEISAFMTERGFVEIERIEENGIEDNVMYKRVITP